MQNSIQKYINKLKKYIKGTEFEEDYIEWFEDIDTVTDYVWKLYNPKTDKMTLLKCNKLSLKITINSWKGKS